ncbi:MAG: S-layer homology domain-containing protein [Candidatus Gracilibacteria bacterium]|nr:S-layer homology domain-containing protein [Candidatus Gracilibacteria bacterium]
MSTFVKKVTSAVLVSALVLTTAGSTAGVNAALMSNTNAANILAENNVIVDYSTNPSAYRTADTIQRKEALKVMIKLSDKVASEGSCTSPFSDIADSDWACKYAVVALEAGFIAANDTFRPDDNVSNIEALKMVMQAKGIARDSGEWKAGYVSAAFDAGIAEVFSDFDTTATRGTMFVWAAEAITIEEEDDDFGGLFNGLLDDVDEPTVDEPTVDEPTVSGDDELTVSLSPETPSDGLAQANTNRVTLLMFDVTAGSEDVTLNQATLNFIGLGDYRNLDEVSIYNSIGEKVSKTKNFTEIEREISFDKNIVVEAGTTMTLTVAGKITDTTGGADNSTYGIKLVDIQASSDVMGEDLVGALLVPAVFANVALLKVSAKKQSGNITIGDTETLVEFDIEEKNDNEDIIVKTITLHLPSTSTIDEDDISNLELYIEGVKVDSTFTVNFDEEIVMAIDYTLAANDRVTFELKGSIAGSVGKDVDFTFVSNDDVYAIGATSGMPVAFDNNQDLSNNSEDLSTARKVEGSEINVSFTKGTQDQARPNSTDIVAGTLNLLALTDNYDIKRLTVTVTASNNTLNKTIAELIENVELGGVSDDGVTGETTQTAVYTFDDTTLRANEAKDLDLTFDILDDNTLNGVRLNFQVAITEVNDDIENQDYTSATTPALSSILSSTALDNKNIDVETGKITVTNVSVIDRDLVIGNGVETVLYKAKISIGDADTITINDFNLKLAANNSLHDTPTTTNEDLDKVIDTATLNIGGQTFSADIDNDSVDFTGISAAIAAGSDNVELIVTAVLKDNDNIVNNDILALELDTTTFDVDNSDGDALLKVAPYASTTVGNSVVLDSANSKLTKTNLKSEGTFQFAIINNGNNKDDIDSVILAGTTDVALAEFKMEADLEDIYVNSLKIKVPSSTSGGTAVWAPAPTTNQANVVLVPAANEVTTLTVSTAPVFAGNIQININGATVVAAVLATDTDIQAAVKIAAAINADGNSSAPVPTTNVVVATSATANTNETDASVNLGGTNAVVGIAIAQGNAGTAAQAQDQDEDFGRAMAAGDITTVTLNGVVYTSTTTIAALIAAANVDATVNVTTGGANIISFVAVTPGTPFTLTNVSGTNVAPTVTGDFSDTLTNVRLMDGSTVIADGGVVTYDSVNNESIIEFKDFTVNDGENYIEGTLVADIRKYTTNGSETSAVLGDVVVNAFTVPASLALVTAVASEADVEGASSDNVILSTAFVGNVNSTAVAVVPAIVNVVATQSFGFNGSEAKLTFNIDKGNNVLNNSDVTISGIEFDNAVASVANIDNDNNATIFTTGILAETTVNGNVGTLTTDTDNDGVEDNGEDKLVSGDIYTLYTTAAIIGTPNASNVKIKANGVSFKVDGVTYKSSNNDIITLGSYSK